MILRIDIDILRKRRQMFIVRLQGGTVLIPGIVSFQPSTPRSSSNLPLSVTCYRSYRYYIPTLSFPVSPCSYLRVLPGTNKNAYTFLPPPDPRRNPNCRFEGSTRSIISVGTRFFGARTRAENGNRWLATCDTWSFPGAL